MKSHIKNLLILALLAFSPVQSAFADFHLWSISEIFSNADGTVQFIELTSSTAGQQSLNSHTIQSNGNNQQQASLTFNSDLAGDTENKTLLLATAQFASTTGLTPDYIIADGFIPISGGNLDFGEGSSTFTFTPQQLPLNGIQSINSNGSPIDATPTNFLGLSATVSTSSHAGFDAVTGIMNVPVVDVPGIGIANISFSVDLATITFTLLDNFYLYDANITAGPSPAQLQDGGVLYIPGLQIGSEVYELNLVITGEDPITFGNPVILSVTNLSPPEPEPEPEPEPDPEPNPDQESIDNGQTSYASLCASCHGASGGGGSAPSLINSFNSFATLRSFIDSSMPQTNPGLCQDTGSSSCATDVANFVISVIQGGG